MMVRGRWLPVLMMLLVACAAPPVKSSRQHSIESAVQITGPRDDATRVYVEDHVCLGGCVSTYPFFRRPSLVVYDDGTALVAPYASPVTTGRIDLEWLHHRLATYLADGVGEVDPTGLVFADGQATVVDYRDAAGAATHIEAALLGWTGDDDRLPADNVWARARLTALLDDVRGAVVPGSTYRADVIRATAVEVGGTGTPGDWPETDPNLSARLATGEEVELSGSDADALRSVTGAASSSRWVLNGRVTDVLVVDVLP